MDDFLQGQRDCKNGISHEHKTEAYNRGYATQYAMEQTLTEITRKQDEYRPGVPK